MRHGKNGVSGGYSPLSRDRDDPCAAVSDRCARDSLEPPGDLTFRLGAFSLVELLLVLVIIGLLAAIAAPRYANSAANQQAAAAAHRIVADLDLARAKARESRQAKTVVFNLARSEVTLLGVSHLDGAPSDYVTALADAPYEVTLVSADLGGDAEVTFDGYGVPDSGGTIVVQGGTVQKTVVLNEYTGRAEAQ